MVTRAYFDTTVYDHIAKGIIPASDAAAVSQAITRGELVAYPSVVDVEELLGQWETSKAEALLRLRVLRNTVGFGQMLKQPSDLFAEAVRAYAAGADPPSVTLVPHHQAAVSEHLHRILDGDEDDRIVAEVLAGVRALKAPFPVRWGASRAKVHAEVKWDSIRVQERRQLSFADFFANGAAEWAEDIIAPLGADVLAACRSRGLDGLLALRPVRLTVGAAMSLVFATTFGDGVQPRHPRRGDGYDLWHATSASTANVFVTGDEALADQLERVPVDGFRVVTSLRAMLDDPRLAPLG